MRRDSVRRDSASKTLTAEAAKNLTRELTLTRDAAAAHQHKHIRTHSEPVLLTYNCKCCDVITLVVTSSDVL